MLACIYMYTCIYFRWIAHLISLCMYNLTVPIICNKRNLMCTFGDLSCISVNGKPTEQEVSGAPLDLNPALFIDTLFHSVTTYILISPDYSRFFMYIRWESVSETIKLKETVRSAPVTQMRSLLAAKQLSGQSAMIYNKRSPAIKKNLLKNAFSEISNLISGDVLKIWTRIFAVRDWWSN